MKYDELYESEALVEGGNSNAKRYSSELGCLCAFANIKNLDHINKRQLANPKKVVAEIQSVLPSIDYNIFQKWYDLGLIYKERIKAHYGSLPVKYGWVAGENAGSVADVVFADFPISGISIKDAGGITLSNLSPRALGLKPVRGDDVFYHYAPKEFESFKRAIFTKVLQEAKALPDTPVMSKYTITYNSETDDFTIFHKKTWRMTEKQIMANVTKNAPWQRPFGDWFQKHFITEKNLMKPLIIATSKQFTEIIEKTLTSDAKIKKILQFEDAPYYYATPRKLFYVPDSKSVGELQVKRVAYDNPNGTSQLFKAEIGNVDSDEGAILDIYIRYANGMFATNATVRAQNLRNPNYIAWEEI